MASLPKELLGDRAGLGLSSVSHSLADLFGSGCPRGSRLLSPSPSAAHEGQGLNTCLESLQMKLPSSVGQKKIKALEQMLLELGVGKW